MWTLPQAFDIQPKSLVAIVGGGGKTSLLFALGQSLPGPTVLTTTTRIFAAQMKLATAVCFANDLSQLGAHLATHGSCLIVGETQGDKALGVAATLPADLLTRPDVDAVLVEADGSRMRPTKAPADHEPVLPAATTHLIPVIGIDALAGPIATVAHRPERVAALTGLAVGDVLTETAVATLLTHPLGGAKHKPPSAKLIPLINKVETDEQLAQARRIATTILRHTQAERVVITALRKIDHRPPTTDHISPSSVVGRPSSVVLELHQPTTAVILAAGLGSRMGAATKQLLPWGNTTVLGQTIRHAQQSEVTDVLVVSGHEAANIEAAAAEAGAATVYNANYAAGEILSSLQTAVRHLPPTCAAILVLLADQPMVQPQTINQLLAAFAQGQSDLIAPVYQGQRGNPVLIGRRYFDELLALPPTAAPRTLLQRYAHRLHLEEVTTDTILRDLDHPEDYAREKPEA